MVNLLLRQQAECRDLHRSFRARVVEALDADHVRHAVAEGVGVGRRRGGAVDRVGDHTGGAAEDAQDNWCGVHGVVGGVGGASRVVANHDVGLLDADTGVARIVRISAAQIDMGAGRGDEQPQTGSFAHVVEGGGRMIHGKNQVSMLQKIHEPGLAVNTGDADAGNKFGHGKATQSGYNFGFNYFYFFILKIKSNFKMIKKSKLPKNNWRFMR